MATLSSANPTILDVANRIAPDGSLDRQIIEMLAQTNGILDDATVVECNDGSGHKTTVRTGLPLGTWRKLYGGVPEKKSTTAQVRDACGMHENYATIDKALADQNGGSAAWRLTEEAPFIEGMNQGVAGTLFYGDTTVNPERFMGLAPRFASSSTATAESADNVIKAGGSSNLTSIWLVTWHPTMTTLLYPKGSKAGLTMRDLGEQTVYDGSNNPFQAYRSHYKWDMGLSVRDWRCIVRISNIDVTALTKNAATGADLIDLMTQAIELLPETASMGRKAFYCNRTIRSFLRRQVANKVAAGTLTMDEVAGKKVLAMDDIPVRRCDQLVNSESAVP
jgi:hypothetical protein